MKEIFMKWSPQARAYLYRAGAMPGDEEADGRIMIPDKTYARLLQAARETGTTISTVVNGVVENMPLQLRALVRRRERVRERRYRR